VSIGYKWLESTVTYDAYYHSTQPPTPDAFEMFQKALDFADVLIGHNIKFDLTWIRECGFKYEGDIYDTMVVEYILSRAQSWPINLASVAGKYGGTQKEKDLVADYIKAGNTFYEIPWDIVREYGIADVMATEEVALKQLEVLGTTFEEIYSESYTHDKAIA
jgi:DNA polymerase I-like protein with 3'-5' exonuclease and polymerase domains